MCRLHLLRRMDEGLARGSKFTLISAPVGYGKTTLVSSWLSTLNRSIAWLSLDAEDDDPLRFWTYVIAALQTIQPELGQAALTALQKAQIPAIENILRDLINQIAALPDKLILVLDDYHLLESASLQQGFNFFLNHLPAQMHVVMVTREDPPLPLPQMRAKGQMVELRVKDLRFTMEESAQFLNHRMNLNLRDEEITILGQRTEGWVAGLQMAALSLHALDEPTTFIKDFAGDNRYIADYLISEVLDRQPEHIREFLLHTAIVDRFTPSLCAALTGDDMMQSSKIIEQIEAQGLFLMPLDHVRQWYRYHQLFADLLRYRLRQNDPSGFAKLNRSASRWYRQQDLIEEAVKYALVGEDHGYVAELIEKTGLVMIGRSQLATLQFWIKALPDETIRTHPSLSVFLVWIGALTGQSDLAKRQLALAEENLHLAKADVRSEIICQIELLRAYAARTSGDLDSSIKHALEALSYLPGNNVFLNCTIHLNLGGNYWLKGNFSALEEPLKHAISFIDIPEVEYPALAATGFLTNTYLQQGQLDKAESLSKEIVERYNHRAHPAAAYVFLERGDLLYERNNLDSALELLSKTVQIGKSADKIINVVRACQLLARVYQVLGDQEKAKISVEQADELFKQATPRYQVMHQIEYDYHRVRYLLFQQNLRVARQWADDYVKRDATIENPWATLNELAYAQVLLADGRSEQALPILKRCEDTARSCGASGWVIQSLALQSLCYQATNDLDRAIEVLRGALKLAEPEGYIRTFVDNGLPMQRLLDQAAKANLFPEYAAILLSAFPLKAGERESTKPQKAFPHHSLVEPLTDQELSILRLMAAGLSHNEIASELYLSINTVKWHTTHIYSKLGVHRRAHAVSRARDLSIL
ncbi:MAG TPA: LuxR C-terminal-related transcriptional regulator [Anaerolineales bacterium]|nr:LuxR C-terminal-related transcriptional regulator [Anaerolineales bacterium]